MVATSYTRGVTGYCRLVAMLPASAPAIAVATGSRADCVARMLRDMRRVGVARVVDFEKRGTRGARAHVIGMVDPGSSVSRDSSLKFQRSGGAGRRIPINAISFRALWIALDAGGTIAELADATGMHRTAMRRAVNALHAAGIVRRSEWQLVTHTWVAVWRFGAGADAARPRASRKVINARYWAARRDRLKFAQMGRALAMQAAA